MVTSRWDSATGELVVRMDAASAQELVRALAGRAVGRAVSQVLAAVSHTVLHPEEGKHDA